jgi:beta-lactamase regulating signal transducer with metallopeptidase domain
VFLNKLIFNAIPYNILTPVQYFNPRRWIYETVEICAADIATDKFAADNPNREFDITYCASLIWLLLLSI